MRRFVLAALAFAIVSGTVSAQESQAAQTTRKRLKQVIDEIDQKDVGTKAFLEDVLGDLKDPIKFSIDNGSGVSNNSKLSYKAKKVTVEKMLNDISDKMDFGWYVVSNAGNNKVDGKIVIRKSSKGKERGYEAGKEPKKSSALERPRNELTDVRQAAVRALISVAATDEAIRGRNKD
jgi:hypothetical protein